MIRLITLLTLAFGLFTASAALASDAVLVAGCGSCAGEHEEGAEGDEHAGCEHCGSEECECDHGAEGETEGEAHDCDSCGTEDCTCDHGAEGETEGEEAADEDSGEEG